MTAIVPANPIQSIKYWPKNFLNVGFVISVQSETLTICTYAESSASEELLTPGENLSPDLKGRDFFIGPPYELKIEELKSLRGWSDHCVWGLPMASRDLRFRPPININAASLASQTTPFWFLSIAEVDIPIKLYVPFKDATFDEIVIEVSSSENFPVIANRSIEKEHSKSISNRTMPKLSCEGPEQIKADETSQFEIKALNCENQLIEKNLEVYIRNSAGYVSKNWFQLAGGVGKFRLSALYLDPGDKIELKLGFRFTNQVLFKEIQII